MYHKHTCGLSTLRAKWSAKVGGYDDDDDVKREEDASIVQPTENGPNTWLVFTA